MTVIWRLKIARNKVKTHIIQAQECFTKVPFLNLLDQNLGASCSKFGENYEFTTKFWSENLERREHKGGPCVYIVEFTVFSWLKMLAKEHI